MGPLPFLVYTSDMGVGLENDLIGYADDHTLKAIVKSPQQRVEVAHSCNRDLVRIPTRTPRVNMVGIKLRLKMS